VRFDGDAKNVIQPARDSHYGQSVILNVKTRRLFVKLCNASGEAKKALVNLSRFPIKKQATKTVLTGAADAENNFDVQPIAPQHEQIKAEKKFTFDLQPYSFVMLEYEL
jgi:hypothetical protein